MSAHEPNPIRETRVGFVTLSLILGVSAALCFVSLHQWGQRNMYRLGFQVGQDASGIERGTPVTIGGLVWGRVTRVESGEVPAGATVGESVEAETRKKSRGTLVTFELDPTIKLWFGAKIARNASILGGDVSLVILETGILTMGSDPTGIRVRVPLPEGTVLVAASPDVGLRGLVGTTVAAQLETLPSRSAALRSYYSENLIPKIETQWNEIQGNVVALRAQINPDYERFHKLFEPIRTQLQSLAAKFGLSDSTEPADPPSLTANIQHAWKSGSADADAVEADLKVLKDRMDQDLTPRFETLSDQATREWTRAKAQWTQLSDAGRTSMEAYRFCMADASLMGGQVSRSFDDLLGSLLKALFGKPNEETETRLQRLEAASQLATATGSLRHACDALDSLAHSVQPIDPVMSATLQQQAADAVAQFRSAIERLISFSQQP